MRDEWTSPPAPAGAEDGASQQANTPAGAPEDSAVGDIAEWDGSAENSEGLHIERLNPTVKGVSPRQITRGLLIAILIALLVGGAVTWPTLAPLGARVFTQARQALFPTPPAPQVWRSISPSYAQSVAFGVNAPQTGYLCGEAGSSTSAPTPQAATPVKGYNPSVPPSADDLRPITLGVSQDSGRSWRTATTPAHGSGCAISVNPTDARDIVLLALRCALCDATQVHTFVWRSHDGGQTWGAIAPPAAAANVTPGAAANATMWPLYVGRVTWAGATLYLAASPGVAAKALLAGCAQGGACVWVDLAGVLAGEPAGLVANPLTIEGMGDRLYVQLSSAESCPPACARDAVSNDGGVTWTPFAPTFRGQPVQPTPESHGAPDLLGYSQAPGAAYDTLLSSADGGATWDARPDPPTGLFTQQILETPDGAIYAWMTQVAKIANAPAASIQQGIYVLAPNGRTWTLVAPERTNQTISMLAFSCDAHGHALAIWGNDLSLVGVAQPAVLVHWL